MNRGYRRSRNSGGSRRRIVQVKRSGIVPIAANSDAVEQSMSLNEGSSRAINEQTQKKLQEIASRIRLRGNLEAKYWFKHNTGQIKVVAETGQVGNSNVLQIHIPIYVEDTSSIVSGFALNADWNGAGSNCLPNRNVGNLAIPVAYGFQVVEQGDLPKALDIHSNESSATLASEKDLIFCKTGQIVQSCNTVQKAKFDVEVGTKRRLDQGDAIYMTLFSGSTPSQTNQSTGDSMDTNQVRLNELLQKPSITTFDMRLFVSK